MSPQTKELPTEYVNLQTQTPLTVLRALETSGDGLPAAEAQRRRLRDGPNAIQQHEEHWLVMVGRQFVTPLVGLLGVAVIISFSLGEVTDGLTIAAILLINGFLGFIQEFRSAQSLKALQKYLTTTATVKRDGRIAAIDRRDLVRGDIVILKAGDSVPADLRLVDVTDMRVDESTLSGESEHVNKVSAPLHQSTIEVTKNSNIAFAGTTILNGEGIGVVIATGHQTVIGGIADLVATTKHQSSFEKNLKQFSTFLIKIVGITLTLVFFANIAIKGDSIHLAEQVLFSLALAVSVIPEALPAVTTITLSRGALMLAKKRVVVKRLTAIEDLGHIQVLCTDKTGTLTENKPVVASFITDRQDELFEALLSAIPPTVRAGAKTAGDPFDAAIVDYAASRGVRIPNADPLAEMPFNAERRRSGVVVSIHHHHRFIVRGAPEMIMPICRPSATLDPKQVLSAAQSLGESGERAIAVAVADVDLPLPKDLQALEGNMKFLGIITFVDPLKASSRQSLLDAERLGVEVKVVTGDSAAVAGAIAKEIGLVTSAKNVITGEQLESLSEAEYQQTTERYSVFARMTPRQKYNLIRSLQQKFTVGFLGEGVNDAPALKLATVSLVVNSAADVAREAADIVLLDRSLQVVVDGIKQGRVIFANVLKYVKYTLIGNFGNFFAIAGMSLIIDFLPMLPIQILLTNVLTDFPLVAVAGDRVDDDDIKQPQKFRLRELGFLTLLLGFVSSMFDFIFFGTFRHSPPATIQSLWFQASIVTELLLIFSIRTNQPIERAKFPSSILAWLTILSIAAAIFLPYTSLGQHVLHLIRPTSVQLFTIAALVLGYFLVTEIVKRLYYRQYRQHSES